MMVSSDALRIVALCTVEAGVDTVAELVRRGISIAGIVGLHPNAADPELVSGFIDVADLGSQLDIPFLHVGSYNLKGSDDRNAVEALKPELILVCGWQRLVPPWLIALPKYGVLGGHGSPDGIHGGRGRSPQTWALMLGCHTFDLALFRITPGIDDGPVLATRTFAYGPTDDIRVSYYRASLAMADMIATVIADPQLLAGGTRQPDSGRYYPQRKPEDGRVDWMLPQDVIARQCRAMTRPYPGLRCEIGVTGLHIWLCQPFDNETDLAPGEIGPCFSTGEFLVGCRDGRLLVREWTADRATWHPQPGMMCAGSAWTDQLRTIAERHQRAHPDQPLAVRIERITATGIPTSTEAK